MIKTISERQLQHLLLDIANKTRREIEQDQLSIDDFEGIARKYGIIFKWREMPPDTDGHYAKDHRVITLNRRVMHAERRNFSFCHELIHDRITRDDDFYQVLHEFTCDMSDDDMERIIERLCNLGASELLIPSDELREIINQRGFSLELIPELCNRFNASSLAVSFKLVSAAEHPCYLIIGEKREIADSPYKQAMFKIEGNQNWHLWVVYSSSSSSAKYNTLGKNFPVLSGHVMYKALASEGDVVQGEDDIPRRNSAKRRWEVKCECMAYKGWVFGFFHESPPISPNQLSLF